MASKTAVKAAGGLVSISQKQTLQSTGIWERLRKAVAISPDRSNGVPLNPWFRNPTPGGLDPLAYDDPVTVPAGDIADNPYWRRDARRSHPRASVVAQADQVALLGVGSAAAPRAELVGAAGERALVAARDEGRREGGLAAYLGRTPGAAAEALRLLGNDGLPPLPSGESLASGKWDVHKYGLNEEASYPEEYPCRSFQ